MAQGAHVLLGAGTSANQSELTLDGVNKFLLSQRPDLVVDGLVDSAAIYVDNQGNYYTTAQSVRAWKN